MRSFFMAVVVMCVVALASSESIAQRRSVETLRVNNLVKVFMHQPGDYTMMYEDGGEYFTDRILTCHGSNPHGAIASWINEKIVRLGFSKGHVEVIIKKDVAPGQEMYVFAEMFDEYTYRVTIHISSPEVFGGAGWRVWTERSRFIEGKTEVVR